MGFAYDELFSYSFLRKLTLNLDSQCATIRLCVVVVFCFLSFPFCFNNIIPECLCICFLPSFSLLILLLRLCCALLCSARLFSLSLLSNFPLDVAAVLCVLTVCRQSIKYKTSLVGDEHIIRASKHVDCVRV